MYTQLQTSAYTEGVTTARIFRTVIAMGFLEFIWILLNFLEFFLEFFEIFGFFFEFFLYFWKFSGFFEVFEIFWKANINFCVTAMEFLKFV